MGAPATMDVTAILDESLRTLSRPGAPKAAQFILMLALIDRAVLPRRIVLANGRARLTLLAMDRRALLKSDAALAPADLTARLADFCLDAHALSHEVHACAAPPAAGFTISELVNAQGEGGTHQALLSRVRDAEGYSFDNRGWPLRIPNAASAKPLVCAWLVHLWMQSWLKRREELLGDNMLLATTGGRRSRELAVRVTPGEVDIMSCATQDLGRLLAACRAADEAQRGERDDSRRAVPRTS